MPKIVIVVAVVILLAVAACAGVRAPLVRGVGRESAGGCVIEGVLSSSALPAVAVLPAAGFAPVAHGVTDVGVPMNASLTATTGARVWYALHADRGRQLAASLAEVGNAWEWSLNPGMTDRQGLPMLDEGEAAKAGVGLTTYTYVRPAAKDPWMPAFVVAGRGWEGDVLLRQYTWWSMANHVKMVVEYREPVPAEGNLRFDPSALLAFETRADDAFRLLRKEQGDALPADVARARRDEARISPRLLAGVLGEAMGSLRLNPL